MWPWRKRHQQRVPRGAAALALAGSSRQELIGATLAVMASESYADRVGIWLQQDAPLVANSTEELHGTMWDRFEEQTPAEWEKLSFGSPLPAELLATGKTVEQELQASGPSPVFGPLLGMHHVLWTPIPGRHGVRGVALAGWQKRQGVMPRETVESVAAQLGLALELEEQQRLASERQVDLRLFQQLAGALAAGTSTDTVLSQLATNCAGLLRDGPSHTGFVLIGHILAPSPGIRPDEMEFLWESGDLTWTHGVQNEPLAGLWKKAAETGSVVGIEPPNSWTAAHLARVTAIPLSGSGETLGVLLAGIPRGFSSLQTLERLQFRASLASTALERRRANIERFRRSVRREALLDASPEATVLLDPGGHISSVNRTAKILLEEPPSTHANSSAHRVQPNSATWYLGARFPQLFSAREQARIEDWLRSAFGGDPAVSNLPATPCEAELLTGVRVRLHAPVATEDQTVAVILDPASRHSAPRQSHSETDLQHVLEWVEEGVLLFDSRQALRAINTRFAQIAGLSPEEASSANSLENLIDRLAPRAADPLAFSTRWRELSRASESGTREEVPLARPVPRVLERSVRPVLDSTGQRLGRLEIYRDLTAQRVFQAKLLQTEKLAALGQMITGVAHELSNPLTSILGYSQRLLMRNDLAGRTGEALQIHQEAERASAILRQLLLTARETRPERKRVALNQIVQKTMELQRFGSAAEKIRIELDLDPALPFVMGDSGQLQQVLMNLIGNARQAIAQEGRPGTIRLRSARTSEHRVQLQVIDDGPGIPQTILARIFDPFFTTKPAGVGTGLGLSIVLSVVREHGGSVHVANLPNGGATFTVELPVAAELAERTPQPAAPEVQFPARLPSAPKSRPFLAEAAPPRSVQSVAKVLVVEDEPTVARLIADVLQDEGMQVDVLLDGREALERSAHQAYDLVICDMKMPGIDGQHFYRSLEQTKSPLRSRFLFVTGDVLAPQTQEFLERNRIPNVAKPFRVEELTEIVHRLLGPQRVRRESAAAGWKAN